VVYLDTSVALAQLLAEDRSPPDDLWRKTLVTSRLFLYETWVRIHGRKLAGSHGELVNDLMGRVSFLELEARILKRALEPFPVPVRTLDAIHLASIEYLRALGQQVELATYDQRQLEAARRLRIPICAGF
jgi:predicted nucleic acid-binding protein